MEASYERKDRGNQDGTDIFSIKNVEARYQYKVTGIGDFDEKYIY